MVEVFVNCREIIIFAVIDHHSMSIKERYHRFLEWQREPFHYKLKEHASCHCANCGHEFTSEFCPVCGQKYGVGKISWNTVRQGIMLLWGMDSRSLPYTLWQLLLRPGYLIHDYISGRRLVSFPPVKMLFIVALAYLFFTKLIEDGTAVSTPNSNEPGNLIDAFGNIMETNPGWGMLIQTSLFILPTWILFRFAPRHEKHTLPEGFFIQVFFSTIILLLSFLAEVNGWFMLLIPIYQIIGYHQLFGYGWWGTFWRIVFCYASIILSFSTIIAIHTVYQRHFTNLKGSWVVAISFFFLGTIILWSVGYYIGKHTKSKRKEMRGEG